MQCKVPPRAKGPTKKKYRPLNPRRKFLRVCCCKKLSAAQLGKGDRQPDFSRETVPKRPWKTLRKEPVALQICQHNTLDSTCVVQIAQHARPILLGRFQVPLAGNVGAQIRRHVEAVPKRSLPIFTHGVRVRAARQQGRRAHTSTVNGLKHAINSFLFSPPHHSIFNPLIVVNLKGVEGKRNGR